MIELTYFDVRGRLEPARLMLELTGTPYQEHGISAEQWRGPDGKDGYLGRTPFGQLPVLRDGELTICQSRAIFRHLARRLDLYGETFADAARVDEVHETADELLVDLSATHWNPRFHELRPQHRESVGRRLELLERYFSRVRADAEHWVLARRYTLGDVVMAYALESTLAMHPGLLPGFPAIEQAMTAFFGAPGVREFVRSERRRRTFTVARATFAGRPEETHHW